MSPIARQELRHFAETVRARREREKEPNEWTPADKTDAFVAIVAFIAFLVCVGMGL